jgi:FkbM family methyltransferase
MNLTRYQSLAQDFVNRAPFIWLAFLNLPPLQRLFNRLGRRPRYLSFLTLSPQTLDGLTVTLDPTDSSQVLIFDEVFLDKIYDFDAIPFDPTHIIDCGGHIGLFTLTALHRFPQSAATVFEPNPDNLPYLKRQISQNELAAKIITAAVSTSDGKIEFATGSSCSGKMLHDSAAVENLISVPTVDFKKVLDHSKPQRLLLKVDIEGAEMEVLPHILSSLPATTALFFETHGGDPDWNSIQSLLAQNGFTVKRTSERGPYSDGFALRTASPLT